MSRAQTGFHLSKMSAHAVFTHSEVLKDPLLFKKALLIKLGQPENPVSPDEIIDGKPLIVIAAENNQPEGIKFLLQKGADVSQADIQGRTAEAVATALGYSRVLEIIREEWDLKERVQSIFRE